MGSELKFVELSSLVAEKPRNGLYKGAEFQGKGHRWIKMGDIYANNFFSDQETELLRVTESEVDRFSCMSGDLLFGRTSLTLEGVGDCMLIGDVSDWPIFESNLFRIRLDQKRAFPLFYFYYFKSPHGKQLIQKIAKQTAAASITATDLIDQPVPFFDMDLQRRIAGLIFSFDNKIALNRQINTTLESMAQALFKSWFVDFDPVIDNALTAGNEIPDELAARAARREALRQQTNKTANETSNKTTGATDAASSEQTLPETGLSEQHLPPEIQQLFPDRFVFTEEMGWVPEGWHKGMLSDVCDVIAGYAFKSKDFTDSGTPVIKIKNIASDKTVDVEDVVRVEHPPANLSDKFKLESGTLLMAMTGATVGKYGLLVNKDGRHSLLNQRVAKLEAKQGTTDNSLVWFIYCALSECGIYDFIVNAAYGSAQPNISAGMIGSGPIVVPPQTLVQEFNSVVNGSFQKILLNRKTTFVLEDLRDSLLPKLLSGQITIPDAEQQLAEVL